MKAKQFQMAQQRPTLFDSTKLVCCREPDSPCPMNTFKHLKWEGDVVGRLPVKWVRRKEGKAYKWYYIMLNRASQEYISTFNTQFDKDPSVCLSDWGYVLESGEGRNIPQEIRTKWTSGPEWQTWNGKIVLVNMQRNIWNILWKYTIQLVCTLPLYFAKCMYYNNLIVVGSTIWQHLKGWFSYMDLA